MLKQRIITGVGLSVVVIAAILFLPNTLFSLVALGFIVIVGGWEWSRLTGFSTLRLQSMYVVSLVCLSGLMYTLNSMVLPLILIVGLLWWIGVLFLLVNYTQGDSFYKENRWLFIIAGYLTLVLSWWLIIKLHAINPLWVLYLVVLIAFADIFAYFSGKRFGQYKLAPELSPKKTLEGATGAILGGTLYALLIGIMVGYSLGSLLLFVALSSITIILSISGDLFESMIKREAGMKDSGQILPGHGGILDRIDSLLAALPIFVLGLTWANLQ